MHMTINENNRIPTLSLSAQKRIGVILKSEPNNSFVRLAVNGGGCSGLSYEFSIEKVIQNDDIIIFESDDNSIAFVTDKISVTYIEKAEIDWKENISGSSFIVNNPNATANCGCGTSFSIA